MFENNENNNNGEFSDLNEDLSLKSDDKIEQKTIQVQLDETETQDQTNKRIKDKYDSKKIKKAIIDTQKLEDKRSRKSLKDIKLKVGIFIIALILYFIRGDFVLSFKKVENVDNNISSLTQEITNLNREIGVLNNDKKIIESVDNAFDNILTCYNEETSILACKELDPILTGKMDIVRNYLLLAKLESEKMDFDQKLMIQSISKNIMKNWSNKLLGELKIVSFGTPQLIDYDNQLYKLQVSLNIQFANINKLIELLSNIENKVHSENAVLYRLESVDYNIMKYEDAQDININLSAYFYK